MKRRQFLKTVFGGVVASVAAVICKPETVTVLPKPVKIWDGHGNEIYPDGGFLMPEEYTEAIARAFSEKEDIAFLHTHNESAMKHVI